MAEIDPATEAALERTWGFSAAPNAAADPTQGPMQAWAGFFQSVGYNVPRHVNRTIRLRAQIRQLGRL